MSQSLAGCHCKTFGVEWRFKIFPPFFILFRTHTLHLSLPTRLRVSVVHVCQSHGRATSIPESHRALRDAGASWWPRRSGERGTWGRELLGDGSVGSICGLWVPSRLGPLPRAWGLPSESGAPSEARLGDGWTGLVVPRALVGHRCGTSAWLFGSEPQLWLWARHCLPPWGGRRSLLSPGIWGLAPSPISTRLVSPRSGSWFVLLLGLWWWA